MITNAMQCLVYLINGNIILNDKVIPIVKTLKPWDSTPCISLDDSGGSSVNRRYFKHTPYEHYVKEISQNINIHVYANSEKDRRSIVNQLDLIFDKAFTDHYELCLNYDKDTHDCATLSRECEARTLDTGRTIKHKCPSPEQNHYINTFEGFNIKRETANNNPSYDIDQLDLSQPLYHSVIKFNCVYNDDYSIGGKILDKLYNKTEVTKHG